MSLCQHDRHGLTDLHAFQALPRLARLALSPVGSRLWVLTPGHAVVWYQTVLSLLSRYVHDREEAPPTTLG